MVMAMEMMEGNEQETVGRTHLNGQSRLADTTVAQDDQLVEGHFPRHGGQWWQGNSFGGEEEREGKLTRGHVRRGREAAHKQYAVKSRIEGGE